MKLPKQREVCWVFFSFGIVIVASFAASQLNLKAAFPIWACFEILHTFKWIPVFLKDFFNGQVLLRFHHNTGIVCPSETPIAMCSQI